MVLSNAERQARFRQRRKDQLQESIDRCLAQRDAALAWVSEIDGGQKHYSAVGASGMREYTDELRAEKVAEAEAFENMANVLRKFAAGLRQ